MKYTDIPIDRARHAHIKFQLALRNLSLADVAEQVGVGPSAVSAVSLGKSRSEKIELHLANVLGQPVQILFPERYPEGSTK